MIKMTSLSKYFNMLHLVCYTHIYFLKKGFKETMLLINKNKKAFKRIFLHFVFKRFSNVKLIFKNKIRLY